MTYSIRYRVLDVPLVAQETHKWCWAAGGQMITSFYGSPVPQPIHVNNRFNRCDCGTQPRHPRCIRGGWPEYEKYGFQLPNTRYKTLSWDELKDQMDKNQPVGFSWEWRSSRDHRSYGSHYMVARGYIVIDNLRLVVVNDPWPVATPGFAGGSIILMTYGDYIEFCPRYVHHYSHYNIVKKENPQSPPPICNDICNDIYNGICEDIHEDIPDGMRPAGGALEEENPGSLRRAALQGLSLLKRLPQPLLNALGFPSTSLLEENPLGEPLSAYIDGSRKLRDVTPQTPANAVEVHYPLESEGEPFSSITIRKRAGKWCFALCGDRRILLAARARRETPLPRGVAPSYFMVDIPVFDLSFLAYFHEHELYFIPTHEDPDLDLHVYQSTPAVEVLLELRRFLEDTAAVGTGLLPGKKLIKFQKTMDKALRGLESKKTRSLLKALKQAGDALKQFYHSLDGGNREPAKPKEN